jgi:hypothetical protein
MVAVHYWTYGSSDRSGEQQSPGQPVILDLAFNQTVILVSRAVVSKHEDIFATTITA